MKTPREILFEKHRGAEQQLDAIRERMVAEHVAAPAASMQSPPEKTGAVSLMAQLWQELFWPYRRVWAGLAVVWVGIIALWATEPGTAAHETVKVTPQMAAAVIIEQRRELALVLGESSDAQAAPPQSPPPRPRSERRINIFAV